jgi:hypothetical protein
MYNIKKKGVIMQITGEHSISGYLANKLAEQFADSFTTDASKLRTRLTQMTCVKEIIGFCAIGALSLIEGVFRLLAVTTKQVIIHSFHYFKGGETRENFHNPILNVLIESIGVSYTSFKSTLGVISDVFRGQCNRNNQTLGNWQD